MLYDGQKWHNNAAFLCFSIVLHYLCKRFYLILTYADRAGM